MGDIDNLHHPEDERQSSPQQKDESRVGNAIKGLRDYEFHLPPLFLIPSLGIPAWWMGTRINASLINSLKIVFTCRSYPSCRRSLIRHPVPLIPLRAGLDSGLQPAGMTTKKCLDYYETLNNSAPPRIPSWPYSQYLQGGLSREYRPPFIYVSGSYFQNCVVMG